MEVLLIPVFILLPLPQPSRVFFLIGWLLRSRRGIILTGWSGWGGLQLRSGLFCAHSPPLLLTFSRRISVLDVAGADVSPSLLVLWARKLGNPIPPSAAQRTGGSAAAAAEP